MRTGRLILFVSLVVGVALTVLVVCLVTRPPAVTPTPPVTTPLAATYPENREDINAWLRPVLGRSVRTAVVELKLDQVERHWVDEPPGILRGATYYISDNRSVVLYLAASEPLYRQFREDRDWDYNALLDCRVGGIQYHVGGKTFDLGSMVPFQFAGERLDDQAGK